jgi:hypothetical protein
MGFFLVENLVNRRAAKMHLPGDFGGTIPLFFNCSSVLRLIERLHPNLMPLALASILPSLVHSRILCRSALATAEGDGNHHRAHGALGADMVVQEAHGNTYGVELLDDLDHVCCVMA